MGFDSKERARINDHDHHDDHHDDDYGDEPSWPVALVVGAIAFFVGLIVRVRDWLGGPWNRLSRALGWREDRPDR